jgi:hypothetical protein
MLKFHQFSSFIFNLNISLQCLSIYKKSDKKTASYWLIQNLTKDISVFVWTKSPFWVQALFHLISWNKRIMKLDKWTIYQPHSGSFTLTFRTKHKYAIIQVPHSQCSLILSFYKNLHLKITLLKKISD